MSENTQGNKNKLVPILIIIIGVLLVGVAVAAVFLFTGGNGGGEDGEPARTIGYEVDAIVAANVDDFQQIMEEMVAQAAEGMVDLNYKHVAASTDGTNFVCAIGNPPSNRYDMYLNIYLDATLEQQLLLTGLLPPGTMIEEFKSEIKLDPGEYESVLVFTQIADDHATIVGQAMVVLTLIVTDNEDILVVMDE